MRKEILEEFKNQLISGNYTQAQNFLRYGDSYCALGVLCNVYQKYTEKGSWEGPFKIKGYKKPAYCFLTEGEYSIELPSPAIMEWAGTTKNFLMAIYRMNDIQKLNFNQISKKLSTVNINGTPYYKT